LTENWEQRQGLLVATLETEPVAYIGLSQETANGSGAGLPTIRVTDLVVLRRLRRHGIGAALLLAGQEWGENRQARRMLLELQPKNYPYIRLAQKMGFDFCGYLDWYFPTHDIGLFFAKPLR
jgi:GNAT superfamily N-acetyltransferase